MRGVVAGVGRWVAVGALLSVLSGCFWPAPGQGPDRRSYNDLEEAIGRSTVAELAPVWEAQLDSGPAGDPITSTAGVHIDDAGSVYGFDATTGSRKWQWAANDPSTPQREVDHLVVHGDDLLVGTFRSDGGLPIEGRTTTLDPGTGEVLSELDNARLVAARGSTGVFVTMFSVRPADPGLPRFSVRDLDSGDVLTSPTVLTTISADTVTLGSERFFFSNRNDNDEVPSPEPLDLWSFSYPPSTTDWSIPLTAGPVVLSEDGATAYVVGHQQVAGVPLEPRLFALHSVSGQILWASRVVLDDGKVLEPNAAVATPPALAHGRLFVPTTSGEVAVFEADRCLIARVCDPSGWMTSGPVSRQPAVANDVVFVGTAEGWVRAFAADGCETDPCEVLWEAYTGSEITGAPAVSNGQLYVGTADGRLIAYGLPDA